MRVVECILINDCLAPKRVGKSVKKKGFRAGQRVRGTVTNVALTPDSQVLALKTTKGYIIPEPFLNVIGEVSAERQKDKDPYFEEIQEAEVIEDGAKPPTNVLDSLKAADIVSSNAIKSKRVVNYALGGAAIGLVYAMLKDGNKVMFSAIGAIGGGIIGNYVGRKIKENERK